MDERGEEFADVRRLKRNWILPIANILLFAIGCVGVWYGRIHESGHEPLGALAMWIGGWTALLVLWRDAFRHERKAALVASPTGIRVDNEPEIRSEDIYEAKALSQAIRKTRDVIELRVRTGPKWWQRRVVRLAMMPPDATRFLALLGVRAGERRATFALSTAFSHRFAFVFAVLGMPWMVDITLRNHDDLMTILFVAIGGGGLVVAPVCAILAAVLGAIVRGRIVIGAEGYTTHWFGWKRYRSFDTVKEVIAKRRAGTNGRVVDTMVVGLDAKKKPKRIIARDAPDTNAQTGAEGRALAQTLQDALDRWLRTPNIARASAQLERGNRSGKDWLAGLDHLVRGGQGNYRVASLTADTLKEVTRASDASTEARIGAAAALLRLEAGTHRTTVRIAAEACAEPVTRQALLDLVEANEDETKLQLALDRVRPNR